MSTTLVSILLIQALHTLLALADPFNITVVGEGTSGDIVSYRVWYGDGQAYVGTNIPGSVEDAVEITSPGTLDEILYIESTEEASISTSVLAQSADAYFMAINSSSTATDPIFFTDTPAGALSAEIVHHWVAYSGYLLPVTASGSLLEAPGGGGAYMVPVDGVEATYSLRWIMDADLASELGGSKVLLSSLPVLVVSSS